jgi:ATP-dependent helicase/DNAse subunit B
VTVSLPYEPGREAFASLARTAEDLAALAGGRVQELPPRFGEIAHPAIAHLERALFGDASADAPPLDGALRFFEGAGTRGALELVGEEILELVRDGTPPERIGVVCPSLERWRAPVETAFETLSIPFALEGPLRLPQTAFGRALLALLRFAWLDGDRRPLFAYLRSPYSGLRRETVDFVEGRLRGRAIATPERVEAEAEALRGARIPALDAVRAADSPVDAVRELARSMLRAAHGLEAPPVSEASRRDLRAHETVARLLGELDALEGGRVSREDVVAALERAHVRGAPGAEPGRVAVLDLLRARTRRFDALFVLGLEEGSLPRRGDASPFLDDDARRRLGGRLQRPDPVGRDRYLFYTACSRPSCRLYLVREAAGDEGSPREPSPFWDEVVSLFPRDDVLRWTRRRPLSAQTWPLEAAPTERERLRALARLAADGDERDSARAVARVNGWERRLERALSAFRRRTRLRHPLVLEHLRARTSFNVTELERFADCSSAWFLDRVIDPRTIDAEVDAKLRGSVAHTALHRFFAGLPKELGTERVDEANVEPAVAFMRRCVEQAIGGVRMEMTEMQRRELEQGLLRDLEQLVREEARAQLPLVPRRFEVSFGSERSAPELQRGLALADGVTLSGKIDRIDVDPFSARGIVQDYKAGKSAHSARDIERELRLQIPLYMLVLRDLVGIEPLGGVYRPLAGDRKPRGLLRADAREDGLPGFVKYDYLGEDEFWGQVERARDTAVGLAERIRGGDVRHDPRGDECPTWCDLWPMCRVNRG